MSIKWGLWGQEIKVSAVLGRGQYLKAQGSPLHTHRCGKDSYAGNKEKEPKV